MMHLKPLLLVSFASLTIVSFLLVDSECAAAQSPFREYTSSYLNSKRNTWWSKKSLEDTDVARVSGVSPTLCQEVTASVACYVDNCVPTFATCIRLADSEASGLHCRLQHRDCALRCFQDSKDLLVIANNLN